MKRETLMEVTLIEFMSLCLVSNQSIIISSYHQCNTTICS